MIKKNGLTATENRNPNGAKGTNKNIRNKPDQSASAHICEAYASIKTDCPEKNDGFARNTKQSTNIGGFSEICAKIIRYISIPPIAAIALIAGLYIGNAEGFTSIWHALFFVFSIALLPISAYILQPFVPPFNELEKRDGQRNLSFVMSNFGYLICILFCLVFNASRGEWVIATTYLLSGAIMVFCNGILHFKASGHACGVVGPVSALVLYYGVYLLPLAVLLIPVAWSSVKLKRHSITQFIIGGAISFFSLIISALIFSF